MDILTNSRNLTEYQSYIEVLNILAQLTFNSELPLKEDLIRLGQCVDSLSDYLHSTRSTAEERSMLKDLIRKLSRECFSGTGNKPLIYKMLPSIHEAENTSSSTRPNEYMRPPSGW